MRVMRVNQESRNRHPEEFRGTLIIIYQVTTTVNSVARIGSGSVEIRAGDMTLDRPATGELPQRKHPPASAADGWPQPPKQHVRQLPVEPGRHLAISAGPLGTPVGRSTAGRRMASATGAVPAVRRSMDPPGRPPKEEPGHCRYSRPGTRNVWKDPGCWPCASGATRGAAMGVFTRRPGNQARLL